MKLKSLVVYVIILGTALTCLAGSATSTVPTVYDKNDKSIPLYLRYGYTDSFQFIRDQLAMTAYPYEKVVGYKYGGSGQEGWDCSGFIKFLYGQFNIPMPRTSSDMSKMGTLVNKEEWLNGDLIFFGTGSNVTHVAMVFIASDGIKKMIHCTTSAGVAINTFDDPSWKSYWNGKFLFAKRIIGN